jgi:hypothetical protein
VRELHEDPAIGLKLPGLIPVEQHHPAIIAAYHARTFRDALQRFCALQNPLLLRRNEIP